jgi:putative superfamily III holin-X
MNRAEAAEPTTELLREALDESRKLVRIELALARDELRSELAAAKRGAIALGAAAAVSILMISLILVAVALALPVPWLAAVLIGAGLFAVSATLGFVGRRALPTSPFERTKGRFQSDLNELKGTVR